MERKPDNRRRFTRVACAAKVILSSEGREESLGRLTDLGIGGLGVLAQGGPLEPGTEVEVRPVVQASEWPPARYIVRWCKVSEEPGWTEIGLGFPGTILDFMNSWIPSLFIGLDFGQKQLLERRDHIRVELHGEASLKSTSGELHEALVLNLGTGGALLQSFEQWDPALTYDLELALLSGERLPLKARLVGAKQYDDRWLYRVCFADSNHRDLDRLTAYVVGLLGTVQKTF